MANMKQLTLITVLFIALVQPAVAKNYETGVIAYELGDYKTALKKFRPLAEEGHAEAQANLGFMYSKGQGVPLDYSKAIKWLSKAAAQESAHAQHNLGIIHGNGLGVPQDHFLAYVWFNIAAGNGHETSSIKRDLAATRLNPTDLKAAQAIARKCRKEPHNCKRYAVPGKNI